MDKVTLNCNWQMQIDFLMLRFEGIYTFAEVYLNGTLLGKTGNMRRARAEYSG